jgi:hypothetical protein
MSENEEKSLKNLDWQKCVNKIWGNEEYGIHGFLKYMFDNTPNEIDNTVLNIVDKVVEAIDNDEA